MRSLKGLPTELSRRLPATTRHITPTKKRSNTIKRHLGGLETTVGLAFDRLISPGVISLERLIELCATNPARILSLHDRGTLRAGARADVTILDPECVWNYDAARSKSKSRNTPFSDYQFNGAAIATIVGGRVAYLKANYSRLRHGRHEEAIMR